MMKQIFLLFLIAVFMLTACAPNQQYKATYEGDFAEESSEQYASIYSNIVTDESEKAERVIGKIEGVPITAKELELEALRVQVIGSEDVYSDAWNRLEIYINAKQTADKYGISVDEDAMKQTNQNRNWIEAEKNGRATTYIHDLCKAYGMTEDEFWDMQLELIKRQLLTSRVKQYLKEHNLPEMNNLWIYSEITDEEYIEKTRGIVWDTN